METSMHVHTHTQGTDICKGIIHPNSFEGVFWIDTVEGLFRTDTIDSEIWTDMVEYVVCL